MAEPSYNHMSDGASKPVRFRSQFVLVTRNFLERNRALERIGIAGAITPRQDEERRRLQSIEKLAEGSVSAVSGSGGPCTKPLHYGHGSADFVNVSEILPGFPSPIQLANA